MAVRKKSKRPARKLAKIAKRSPRKRAVRRRAAQPRLAAEPAEPLKFIDVSAAPRCRSRIPVEIEIAGRRERGAIADMSASGARIVGIRLDLPPGTPLQIHYASGSAPVLLAAEIVRVTADGFAVKILPR
ncbi:MAG: PilZ domain-containing protein [Myxococcota bacterium]